MAKDATTDAVPDRIGIRELNSRLSECVGAVAAGAEITITRQGRPVARLAPVEAPDPLEQLRQQGLLVEPDRLPPAQLPRVKADGGGVSDLVKDQRR